MIGDQWKRLVVYGRGEKDPRVDSPSEEVVVCADRCREIYRPFIGWKGQLSVVAFASFWMGLAAFTGVKWLAAVGMIALGGFVVIPLLGRSHRFFANLPCPQCGEPVGKYETRKTRIHLCCVHCGYVAPTDCRIYYSGQIPEKG